MRTHILLVALAAVVAAPTLAVAQGYYQNTLRRNPYTGRWEVVPSGQVDVQTFGPYRNQRSFYGETYNPYDGTLTRSAVQRNPITGRLEVLNDYYNPYTGARFTDGTRFNPITGRYETANVIQPPTNPIPSVEVQPPAATGEVPPPERTTARKPIVKPKIIENQFPPTAPQQTLPPK